MRNLNKILELLSADSAMDYCEEFDQVKSVLEFCHTHVKPFNKLHFRGGNEQILDEICTRMQRVLIELGVVDADSKDPIAKKFTELRKIMLFLLANTDFSYKYNLRDDPNIVHIVELCPLIPKFVMLNLTWNLKLDRFFYEVLSYSPCWFAFQYFDAACESLKYITDSYDVLEKVDQLIRAIIVNLARSERRKMDGVDTKIIFSKLYDYTINILRLFYTPDAEKFKSFSKDDLSKYSGFALKHILGLVLFSFDVYETDDAHQSQPEYEIFDICQNVCMKNTEYSGKASKPLQEQQLKIILALLNSLQYNMMLVKVEDFMYWVEIDLTPTENLQMCNGEMMYHVSERILANEAFSHDVQKQLAIMAIRPKSAEELAKDAALGQILRKLSDNLPYETKLAWFNELFSRQIVFGNDECLQTIKENLKMMTLDHCKIILDFMKLQKSANLEINGDDSEDFEELVHILVLVLENLITNDIIELIVYKTKLFGESSAICCGDNFQNRIIEYLNKLTADFDLRSFLILGFENPYRTWTAFFDSACSNPKQQLQFCTVVCETEPFSKMYFGELLNEAMCNNIKLQEKNFPEFLSTIYFNCYYPQKTDEFLKKFVNKNVVNFLGQSNFLSVLSIIKLLNLISEHVCQEGKPNMNLGESTAPVLVIVFQIMEESRWDFVSYNSVRDEIVQRCINFIELSHKNYLPVASEKDRLWIKQKIRSNFRRYNLYYFQAFMLEPGAIPLQFDAFLIRNTCLEDNPLFLLIHIVRCTDKEIEMLTKNNEVREHLDDVLDRLTEVVSQSANSFGIDNYRRILAVYGSILTNTIIPSLENDADKFENMIIKVLQLVAKVPKQIYEETFVRLEPQLESLLDKCISSAEILNVLSNMKDCIPKSILMDKMPGLEMK